MWSEAVSRLVLSRPVRSVTMRGEAKEALGKVATPNLPDLFPLYIKIHPRLDIHMLLVCDGV